MDYYSHLRKTENISLGDAINLLAPMFMKLHIWNSDDRLSDVWIRKRRHIERVTLARIKSGTLTGDVRYLHESDLYGCQVTDYEGSLVEYIDYSESWVNLTQLLNGCYDSIIKSYDKIPEEFRLLLPERFEAVADDSVTKEKQDDPVVQNEKVADIFDVDANDVEDYAADASLKYPVYTGVMLEDISEKKFEELKKYYSMLQVEVAKLIKTVQIATTIGLLFYEKGLDKPATANAFREAFKAYIGGIPMRLVSLIYDSLHVKYKSFAGDSTKGQVGIDDDTLDLIIETSVAAGLICGEDEILDAKGLEQQLSLYEFELPPPDLIRTISGACKRVYKKYQKQRV